MKKSKKNKITVGVVVVVVAAVVGGSVYLSNVSDSSSGETAYKEVTVERGNLTVGVTESGSISIGTITQEVDFSGSSSQSSQSAMTASSSSSSSAALEVEEVYVSVGQVLNEGDAILKLTDESVEEYRKELTDAVTEASSDLSQAQLTSAKTKLSASYSYNLSVAKGSVAQAEYETTLSDLAEAVEEAQEAVDESAALISYYQEMIEQGVNLAESLYDEQQNYDELSVKLKSAQSAYTTKSIEAEKTYQESVFSSNNASSQYSADTSSADIAVEDAQATLEDAEEALSEFEEFIGDGTIYADYAGTVTAVGYEEGDELSSSTAVATIADSSAVTITVSVSEEDITNIATGDEVIVELTAYEGETFPAVVQSMDTTVSSGSSTVSYNVEVLLTGETDGIYADMTGNVTFVEKQVEDVLYVSNKAVTTEDTVSYVKVKKEDGTIEQTEVTTGFSDGVYVEIQSGLSEGDTVLIESKVTTS